MKGPERVQAALRSMGLNPDVVELPQSTRTAAQAAEAVGCEVGQIAKSLVFRGQDDGSPLLVIASGSNRVNEAMLGSMIGQQLELASPDFVRSASGYAIGGVPPVGHENPLRTIFDQDLMQYEEIWAAAGSPFAVFPIAPAALAEAAGAEVVLVT
jgi:prolyl-tRNA editing enzyme YbaK/EbsC (Cys-tRNA(Pro) deacylase)